MEKYRNKVIVLLSDLVEIILESKWVDFFKRKYPLAFRFISARLSLHKFRGLPLTLLLIALSLNLLLLADFTEDVINSREFIVIDGFLAEFLFNIRFEPMAKGFYYFSLLCSTQVVTVIGIILCIYLLTKRVFHYVVGIISSMLGSGLSIYFGKNIFEVSRPHEFAYYEEIYFSFPSGHAVISIAFYGLIFYLLLRRASSVKSRILISAFAVVFCILIGISRLYLGVHYLSDVLAGFILGALWLLLSISMIEWQEDRLKSKKDRVSTSV
jgi:undecaprenyl-diphosphatase